VLAGVTIWALATLLLVWFWVRHYLPLGPQYFKLWLFSWLFSEVIPLHFLDVPYKRPALPDPQRLHLPVRQDLLSFSRSGSGTTRVGHGSNAAGTGGGLRSTARGREVP
jgi:hypothetical protein